MGRNATGMDQEWIRNDYINTSILDNYLLNSVSIMDQTG